MSNVATKIEMVPSDALINVAIADILYIEGLNKRLDMGELKEFAEGIKINGITTPIMVRAKGSLYELVAGHRRVAACKLIGMDYIPAIVRNMSDTEIVILNGLENIARKDLNPVEEGETLLAIATAMGTKGKLASAREVGRTVGKNNVTVGMRLKLAQASDMLKKAVRQGKLDSTRADRLIKDGKDDPANIAEAMTEHAIAKVNGEMKRADTMAGIVTPAPVVVTPAPAKSLAVTDDFIELPKSEGGDMDDEDFAAAQAIANIASKTESVKIEVTPAPESMELPAPAPVVTIVPPKNAPLPTDGKPAPVAYKVVQSDTIKSLLACVTDLLRDEPSDSARYGFLQGVQFGYQVICGLETDANIPEEWEMGL